MGAITQSHRASPPASISGSSSSPPINAEIGLILTDYAILKRVNLSDPQEKLRLSVLIATASERMDADTVRAALKVWADESKWLPDWSELKASAQDFLANRRLDMRLARERQQVAERRALPAPEAPTFDITGLLAELAAKGRDFEMRNTGEAAAPFIPHRDRPLVIEMPAMSDASDALKAMVARGAVL